MSPLRFFGFLVAGSRRIGRPTTLLHQSLRLRPPSTRSIALGVGGFRFSGRLPLGDKSHVSVVTVGALSAFVGGMLSYLKGDAEEPAAQKLTGEEETMTDNWTLEEKDMKKRFEEWMIDYGRKYKDNKEKAMRYKIFKRNAEVANEHNSTPGESATWGTNVFADRTDEEFPSCGCRMSDEEREEALVQLGMDVIDGKCTR